MKKIQVLIIDDSALVRQSLKELLNSDPEIEVMDTAADPYVAAAILRDKVPDVITLDVEMPRMDGITFLQKLMSQHPIPVVMLSSLTESGCETALKALELGAVEILTKPKMGVKQFIDESKILITDAIKAASQANMSMIRGHGNSRSTESATSTPTMVKTSHRDLSNPNHFQAQEKLSADAMLEKSGTAMLATTEKIILIGASTGGTEALKELLDGFPSDVPGTVIVQHMPEKFTTSFAQRLNSTCKAEVKEAADGDGVFTGRILIAPGGKHTLLKRSGARYYVEVKDGPLVSRHKPSVDVLFRSGARYAGKNAVGAILTGMGDDGAKSMLEMKEAGAYTIAQDKDSCVVFGMPQEAIKLGAVSKIVPLKHIAQEILNAAQYTGR